MKKGLAILLAVLCLLLCACHRDVDTAPQTISLTNVYTAAPLSAPEMQADVSSCQPFVYGDSLYLFDRIQNLYLYYYYRVDYFNAIRLHSKYPDKPLNPPTSTVTDLVEAVLTDEELEAFRDLIRGAVLYTGQDDMVTQILSEELDPYFAGDRTAEATAEIIEKRVGIYLAE